MDEDSKVVVSFIEQVCSEMNLDYMVWLKPEEYDAFDLTKCINTNSILSLNELSKIDKKYDLILADLFRNKGTPQMPIRKLTWDIITMSLKGLSKTGRAIFQLPSYFVFSTQGKKDFNELKEKGYGLNAIFNTPGEQMMFNPQRPVLLSFSRTNSKRLFIGEILKDNSSILANNYVSITDTDHIETGKIIDKSSFESFSNYKINNQIARLKTQYKEYKNYKLGEISNIKTRDNFDDLPNSIYIPKRNRGKVISRLKKAEHRHRSYFQVQLDDKIVLSEYMALFYRSDLGRLILNSLFSGSLEPTIHGSGLLESHVAVPDLEEQKLLIYTANQLSELQKTMDELQVELSLNPKNANTIIENISSVQGTLKSLSQEDKILALIRKGEGKKIEFKQTFTKNIHTGLKDKNIEKASLKTIAGFLNTDGGTLLIGVADDGLVTGVGDDFYVSNDKYLLHFKNLLQSKIGPEFYPLINYDIYTVLDKMVLMVECKASNEPCLYEEIDFYVRTNPATDRLQGKKLLEYIKVRFTQ